MQRQRQEREGLPRRAKKWWLQARSMEVVVKVKARKARKRRGCGFGGRAVAKKAVVMLAVMRVALYATQRSQHGEKLVLQARMNWVSGTIRCRHPRYQIVIGKWRHCIWQSKNPN
jgi:hypothetical protein